MSPNKLFVLVITGILGAVLLACVGSIIETVDNSEVMFVQSLTGEISYYNTPGPKLQMFGKVTKYPQRDGYEFSAPIQFNDGGHATMNGSIQYEYPVADEHAMRELLKNYPSASAVRTRLIQTTVDKTIYLTGQLMSSTESFAEKRGFLLSWIDDQVARGVYRTQIREEKTKDMVSGQDKTTKVVEVVNVGGVPARQEKSAVESFGIKTFGLALGCGEDEQKSCKGLDYDDKVEKQIQDQQNITMRVQTAIANAKEAEQNAITIEKQGEANAAKAKWDQEVLKATAVTKAEQELEVARLDAKTAEQEKLAKILRAEGEAEYKRRVMVADGALTQKLEAYVQVNAKYAEAIAAYNGNWVPTVVTGSSGSGSNGANNLVELLTAKSARDLALDLSVPRQGK